VICSSVFAVGVLLAGWLAWYSLLIADIVRSEYAMGVGWASSSLLFRAWDIVLLRQR
jgi:hypothetical protein